MAHKTLIGGTAYEVSGGKTRVNSTGYSIAGGKTRVNGTGYDVSFSPYDDTFSNNDWALIIAACKNNEVPASWSVGNSKPMTINGTMYNIDIIGKNHDVYSDGSGTAPLTFQLHECYSESKKMHNSQTNTCGWTNCAMRTTCLPSILALMPSEIQSAIKEVNKVTSVGNKSRVVSTTADKLFLLAEVEVFGVFSDQLGAGDSEGSRYAYYAEGRSALKTQNGAANNWWLRSPRLANQYTFCAVSMRGEFWGAVADASHSVSFAFCF